jgi:protein-disulfide isomerase
METSIEHRIGPQHPNVILLEYGDYECPYSGKANSIIKKLINEFDTDLAYIYRHFPLINIHTNAGVAAMAAEAAALQGKFWEMHNTLFKNQSHITFEFIIGLAKKIHLNEKKFLNDIENEQLWKKIESNIQSGIQKEVTGTPTFFINGLVYNGPTQYDEMKTTIEIEIEKRGNSTSRLF